MRHLTPQKSSIDKALIILSSFGSNNTEMGTLEISRKLGFHPATVSRILLILSRHNFLKQNPRTKKFTIGHSVLRLARSIERFLEREIVFIAKPHMDELRDKTGESVFLEVLSGDHTFIAYISEGTGRIRLDGNIGDALFGHVAAGAKAILAFSPPEVLKRVIYNGPLKRFTPNTITDPEVLEKHLADIKRNGFSFNIEEHDVGVSAVGAPIFNNTGKPVAAVVVAGSSHLIKVDSNSSIVKLVKETAAEISSEFNLE